MSVPYVIEKEVGGQERVYDLFSRLLRDRIVFIRGVFNSEMADTVVAQLLFLESDSPTKDIYMYINSPGGEISSMFCILDTMKYIRNSIVTIGMGTVASAASLILAAGTKGKRYALPNTEIMIHQLSSGLSGKYKDMKNNFEHTKYLHNKLMKYYAEFTSQKLTRVKKDMELDYFMTPENAKKYGIIDEIQYNRE